MLLRMGFVSKLLNVKIWNYGGSACITSLFFFSLKMVSQVYQPSSLKLNVCKYKNYNVYCAFDADFN